MTHAISKRAHNSECSLGEYKFMKHIVNSETVNSVRQTKITEMIKIHLEEKSRFKNNNPPIRQRNERCGQCRRLQVEIVM